MAQYAVGDIQGCYHTFIRLLQTIQFDATQDKLWLLGDIVNRGMGSLSVLRWCYQQQDCVRVVLGNHDLHTLAVACGAQEAHASDTLNDLVCASDKIALLDWLRQQPLAHETEYGVLIHAGLLPQWTIPQALSYAQEVSQALQADNYADFLRTVYGNTPSQWQDDLAGIARLRVITNALTRLRICTENGDMDLKYKGGLSGIPRGYVPWFAVPQRASLSQRVFFGHWSHLGLYQAHNCYALDTGCAWGGLLSACELSSQAIVQVPVCLEDLSPRLLKQEV